MPTYAKGKYWFTDRLRYEFTNSSYEGAFSSPWKCREAPESIWTPSNKAPLFVNAVNCWVYLSTKVVNPFVRRCLLLQIDSYMPQIVEIDNCGSFSRFGRNDSTYWKRMDDKLMPLILTEVLPPSKTSKNPILHLLSKALPQRCQIRNLREIIISYCNSSDATYAFIMMILRKSLFGLYSSAEVKLNFQGRLVIYKALIGQLCSKSFFTKWFRREGSAHQVYIFYCLKEYLINSVMESAPTYEVLDKKYGWGAFHRQVKVFMDLTRKKLNIMAQREFKFLQRSDWLASIETILTSAAKQHVKLFRTTPQLSYYSKLRNDISKFFNTKDKYKMNEHLPKPVEEFLWKYAQRCDERGLCHSLYYLGCGKELVEVVWKKTLSAKDFHKYSMKTLEYIAEVCRLQNLKKNMVLYTLPEHIYKEQVRTLAIKERKDIEDDSLIGPYKPHPTAALNYVCFVCNDVKIFTMQVNRKNNRHSNRLSRGSLRIVVNNEHDCMSLCCGRRPERHTKNGKRKFKDSEDVQLRKIKKEKKREAVANRCIATPCQQIDLLGHAFHFFNKLYMLCSLCGNAFVLEKNAFSHAVLPNCQCCHEQEEKPCVKCKVVLHTVEILCLDRRTGRFVTANFCNNCSYTYASKQPILL